MEQHSLQLSKLPLAVDLDGTLVRTDTLLEQILHFVRNSPLRGPLLIWLLFTLSKPQFKTTLAKWTELNPANLPYRQDFLDFIRREKKKGRVVVLATAAHISIARSVAAHLEIFDDVIATTAEYNVKGGNKSAVLEQKWGAGGFVYAGDSFADRSVWATAGGAILVGHPERLRKICPVPVEKEFTEDKPLLRVLLKEIRIYQWMKNILVFVPMLAAGQYANLYLYGSALMAFLGFSLMASSIYIINDLLDLDSDRQHHSKRLRPFASGELPLHFGFALSPLLFLLGTGLTYSINPYLTIVTISYGLVSIWYSFHLKTLLLIDVFTLAALYSVRVLGGGVATGYIPSTWLLSFSGLLFLSLAFLKRYVETAIAEKEETMMRRRGYFPGESQVQMQIGLAASFSATVVYSIWIDSTAFQQTYSNQIFLWLITPMILLWQCRLWFIAFRGQLHDDPIIFTATDKVSWCIFIVCLILYILSL